MRTLRRVVGLMALASVLCACRSTGPEQTATAAYDRAAAEIESLRGSATVARARMQTTLDHAGTRVAQAMEAGVFLRFNLENLGTSSDFIDANLQALVRATAPAAAPVGLGPGVTPLSPPTAVPIASPAPNRAPAPTADLQPRLENPVLASGVGGDDCALDANPRFTTESSEIYVVGVAHNIAAGARIESRWKRRGAEVARFTFQPDFAINGNCVWFFIDQSDAVFTLGAWSVEILVDDVSVTPPLAFQIVEA